ncbi:vacuolar ATPase assembly integral membrane protein VMA21 homolog [Anthonomus grandis grandis]|uniref:vacuolar ATPase assembly integral membrane protein VMA21 homolog n=1 Tax=Anthonomus grandis grandis TaxID=2921223 RepID=UPI002164F63A|nr:vacuolar ATPase assembly integral membrane protein VMA21 homolog [Anthonomus grandis grandis]
MEQPQFTVFKTVLAYSVFILASPVLTFFFTKFIFFEGLLGVSSTASNVWSAVLAIVVLHIALGMYILRAYSEADRTKAKPAEKVD